MEYIKDLNSLRGKFQHVHKYYNLSDKELIEDNFLEIIEDLKGEMHYTEEDLRKAFKAGLKRGHSGYPNTDNWIQKSEEVYIESLKETDK